MSSRRVPLKMLPHSRPPLWSRYARYLLARSAPVVLGGLVCHAWALVWAVDGGVGVEVDAQTAGEDVSLATLLWGSRPRTEWMDSAAYYGAVGVAAGATELAMTAALVAASLTFLQRNNSLRQEPPRSWVWPGCALAVVVLQVLESAVLADLRNGCCAPLRQALPTGWWLVALVAVPMVTVAVGELVKRLDLALFTREMHGLRIIFDTRLGMHSPQ